ncbi:hypothetical protein CBR_g37319 [Chara braunii]|uniref:Reverse transcriptase n=1 Tax=Chara braunii TaxID=69332 RepID=A0A388JZV9_CHABU|nr:hypothetical protein CBR_g37319 [Chara braunii]|eukprot:GBG63233.1 hypothetical protein CBR_g37319 [Chara braunii]
MPFGLTNAPATFQRAMNDIFRDILEQYILVYLDDILVYSRTLEEHLRHLHDVLDRLRRHGFYAKLSKCRLAQHKLDFLGHYVSDQGLHMDDAKITAIAEWPAPTFAKQLRSFLGLTSYYSNFIRGYARYSYVLTSTLLRKNLPWAWTPLHEDAFRALKKAVTCAPVLHLPDFDHHFIITTDASDFAVGAVLSQVFPSSPDSSHPRIPRFPPPTPTTASRLTPTRPATDEPSIDYSPTIAEDGTFESRSGDCPIAFYSRQLLHAREVLAVVYAARHWRHYLHGAPFTVRTDNSVVQAFLTKPKLTPRQTRWWRDLFEFSFTTEHIKGETNRVADALSRRPDHDQEHIQLSSISVSTVHHSVIDEFRTQYRHCPDYRDILATLRSGKTVPNYSLGDNGLVYSTGQLRVRAVAEFHDRAASGHMGFHKTLARVSRLYVWPKRKDFMKDYECPTSQEVNSANHLPYVLRQPLPIPEGRWQSISMDFIGPLRPPTPRGHDAILVVVDRFTKRARLVPCPYAISAREVADIVFDRVVLDHDLPLSIISDRDPRFTSRFWRRLHECCDDSRRAGRLAKTCREDLHRVEIATKNDTECRKRQRLRTFVGSEEQLVWNGKRSKMSAESAPGGLRGVSGSEGRDRDRQRGHNPLAGKTCYKCGEADHFAGMCVEYWKAKAQGVSFVLPPVRTGRTMNTGPEQKSHSAESTGPRSEQEKTNRMMREYFIQLAQEKKDRAEREALEMEQARERAVKLEKERRRQEKLEEKNRYEDKRDARLIRTLRAEMKREESNEAKKYDGRSKVESEEEDDAELIDLRRRASALRINKKRKRAVDVTIENSPPMKTPAKEQRVRLIEEAQLRIEHLRSVEKGKASASASVKRDLTPAMGSAMKLGLSLKHVTTGTNPGAQEKFEREIRELYEALTIEELKEQCKIHKIAYGNRDLAVKKLVTRRTIEAYDPVNIPSQDTPRVATRSIKKSCEDVKAHSSEEEASNSESEDTE